MQIVPQQAAPVPVKPAKAPTSSGESFAANVDSETAELAATPEAKPVASKQEQPAQAPAQANGTDKPIQTIIVKADGDAGEDAPLQIAFNVDQPAEQDTVDAPVLTWQPIEDAPKDITVKLADTPQPVKADDIDIDIELETAETELTADALQITTPAQPAAPSPQDVADSAEDDAAKIIVATVTPAPKQPDAKATTAADKPSVDVVAVAATDGAEDAALDGQSDQSASQDQPAPVATPVATAKPAGLDAPAEQPTLANTRPAAESDGADAKATKLETKNPEVDKVNASSKEADQPKANQSGTASVADTKQAQSTAERPAQLITAPTFTPSTGQSEAAQARPVPEVVVQVPQQRADMAAKQVGLEISRQVAKSETNFIVRMDPPELGKLDVRLTMTKTADVSATILVEREATLELLSRDLKALERALNDAGLKTDQNSLQLSLKNQGFDQNSADQGGSAVAGNGGAGGDSEDDLEADGQLAASDSLYKPVSDRPVDIVI